MTIQTTAQNDWPVCKCGCGRPAMAAKKNDLTKGLRKGDPRKFATAECRNPSPLAVVDITRVCTTCGTTKALNEFARSGSRKDGYTNRCKPCDQNRRKALRAAKNPNPYGEMHRKLPPYEELKALYLGTGGKTPLTYAQIAQKFGVHYSTVRATIKQRAERRGEWPLLSPAANERRRLQRIQATKVSVTPVGIAFVVEEFLEKEGMTRREFAEKFNFDYRYIVKLLAPSRHDPIAAPYAVRLLEACGEPVVWSLRVAANKARKAPRRHSSVG